MQIKVDKKLSFMAGIDLKTKINENLVQIIANMNKTELVMTTFFMKISKVQMKLGIGPVKALRPSIVIGIIARII